MNHTFNFMHIIQAHLIFGQNYNTKSTRPRNFLSMKATVKNLTNYNFFFVLKCCHNYVRKKFCAYNFIQVLILLSISNENVTIITLLFTLKNVGQKKNEL